MFKVHDAPKVYVIGHSSLDFQSVFDFLRDEGGAWERDTDVPVRALPELAGRICYMSFGEKQGRKSNDDYIRHIIEVGHGSVLEHATVNFIFTGISRSLSLELARHRVGIAISQLSQRYVDSSDAGLVMPPALLAMKGTKGESARERVRTEFVRALEAYDVLTEQLVESLATPDALIEFAIRDGVLKPCASDVSGEFVYSEGERNVMGTLKAWREMASDPDKGWRDVLRKATSTSRRKSARETARSVLPNCTETKMVYSMNCRALRHFFTLRGAPGVEMEFRRFTVAVFNAVKVMLGPIVADFQLRGTPDGIGTLWTPFPKV